MKRTALLLLSLLISAQLFAASASEVAAAGKAALDADQYERAAELFEKAIALEPRNAEYHYLLGNTYGAQAQRAGMLKQASLAKKIKAEFEKAVQLDPNYIAARFALIDYYTIAPGFMGGSMDKAKEQAAEIKKRDALEGHRAFARVYSRDKKMDLARKEVVDGVRENPNSAKAHTYLGRFLLSEKNYSGSQHELEMAVNLDAAYMPAHYYLGAHAAQSATGYARGEESLKKYLAYKPGEGEPQHQSAWYWLGMIFEKQGKKAEARQSYLKAQKLAPKSKEINEALKRVS